MVSEWRIGLLGPTEVWHGARAVPLGRATLRVLLATLALEAGHTVAFDRLVERLWGQRPPATARNTLQVYAMRLRRALGDDAAMLVNTGPSGYRLAVPAEAVDVTRFESLLARAHRATGDIELATLEEALALWRGPALADVPSDALQRRSYPAWRSAASPPPSAASSC